MENNNKHIFIYYLQLKSGYKNKTNWTEETYQIIEQHADFLEGLGKKGDLILAGRTLMPFDDEIFFGIALLKAISLQEAKKLVANDPTVLNKIHIAKVFPFSMSIRYLKNCD